MTLSILTKTKSYCLQVKIANNSAEILECQNLIAETYYENFGISLSDRSFNVKQKVELYPHYYLMGTIDDRLVATVGLYLYNINSQQYTNVTDNKIESALKKEGLAGAVSAKNKRELSKFVIKKEWRNKGIARPFIGVAHCKNFIHLIGDGSHILVNSALSPTFKILDSLGIKSRPIEIVPARKIYQNYRKKQQMETRVTIPYFDIPSKWYNFKLPGNYEIAAA